MCARRGRSIATAGAIATLIARPAAHRRDRLGAAGVAATAATASCSGGHRGRGSGAGRDRCCCSGRRAPGRRRRCSRIVGARRACLDPGAARLERRSSADRPRRRRVVRRSMVGARRARPVRHATSCRRRSRPPREIAIGKRQPPVRLAVGAAARSRSSPRGWCSPSSTSGRG